MTGPAVPRIDETGIAAMEIGEGATQPLFVLGRQDDMDVVGHQAIGPDFGARV